MQHPGSITGNSYSDQANSMARAQVDRHDGRQISRHHPNSDTRDCKLPLAAGPSQPLLLCCSKAQPVISTTYASCALTRLPELQCTAMFQPATTATCQGMEQGKQLILQHWRSRFSMPASETLRSSAECEEL